MPLAETAICADTFPVSATPTEEQLRAYFEANRSRFPTPPKADGQKPAAVSLDGYIAGPNGEHDWIVMDPEIDFGKLFARFDKPERRRDTGAGMSCVE